MAELRQRLLEALIEALTLTQQRSGRPVSKIDPDTIPFIDLDNFDSHNGVEAEILVVDGEKEFLIPFAESICVEVDVEGKSIKIDPPEGLLDF